MYHQHGQLTLALSVRQNQMQLLGKVDRPAGFSLDELFVALGARQRRALDDCFVAVPVHCKMGDVCGNLGGCGWAGLGWGYYYFIVYWETDTTYKYLVRQDNIIIDIHFVLFKEGKIKES